MSDILNRVKKFAILENTRMIYDGINDLCMSFFPLEGKQIPYTEINKRIKTIVNELINGNEKFLLQNPLTNFFKFMYGSPCNFNKNEEQNLECLSKMAEYFLLVQLLNNGWKSDSSPYVYEKICNCMCDILGYSNCYIVKLNSGTAKIVQQSSSTINDHDKIFEERLRSSDHKIIKELNGFSIKGKENKSIADTLLKVDISFEPKTGASANKFSLIIIKIKYTHNKKDQEFYFVLNKHVSGDSNSTKTANSNDAETANSNDAETANSNDTEIDNSNGTETANSNDTEIDNSNGTETANSNSTETSIVDECTIVQARNILFLHRDMSTNLERDHHALMNLRHLFAYIEKTDDKNCNPTILHISDLHIDSSKNYNFDAIEDKFKKLKNIDLLLITGDIIQAGESAKQMEDNYEKAEKIIFKIACALWANDGQRLRADWKKRILIVPGNHDYASMNESATYVDENRVVKPKGAARYSGSVMVRFAYFINFMRKCLDVDLNFVDDKLNYIREYKKLGSRFICLNSSVDVSSRRSNKVTLDSEYLNKIVAIKDKGLKNYILIHHTPAYMQKDLSYFADKQGVFYNKLKTKYASNQSVQSDKVFSICIKIIEKIIGTEPTEIEDIFKKLLEPCDDIKEISEYCDDIKEISEYCDAIKEILEYCDDIKEILELVDKPSLAISFINNIKNDISETKTDKASFSNDFTMLTKKLSSGMIAIFGGHTHKCRDEKIDGIQNIETDRLFSRDKNSDSMIINNDGIRIFQLVIN